MLRTYLPSKVKLIATDLNEPMFRQAPAKFGKGEKVRWLEADACDLPFDDRKFDAVVCQFGIMSYRTSLSLRAKFIVFSSAMAFFSLTCGTE